MDRLTPWLRMTAFPHGLLLAALMATEVGVSAADTFVPKAWESLVAEAEQIFIGTVATTSSTKLPSGAIVTDVSFPQPRMLKGTADGEMRLRLLGGTVNDETQRVSGFPHFEPGATYLAFVKGNGRALLPLVGGTQGLFRIIRDPIAGDERVFGARGEALMEPAPGLSLFIDAIAEALRR
jgi:hypothetical protein